MGSGMRVVEVVVTVRVPVGTDVAAVTETVASWSAPLDAGVGWRVLAVEGVEPCGGDELGAVEEATGMTEPLEELCAWCETELTRTSLCGSCRELMQRHADAAHHADGEMVETAWHELEERSAAPRRTRRDRG
jgi:hypothetical protein